MGRLEAVKSCALFSGMPEEAFTRLAAFMQERRFDEGGLVFTAGDRGSSLFVIEAGNVQVLVNNAGGEETVLSEMGPGGHFGSLSLLQGGTRMVTVRARPGAVVHELTLEGLLKLRAEKSDLAFRILLLVARDFARTVRENEGFMKDALAARLGRGSFRDA
jgi:CRP/FNR family transcriptional regulator